MIRNLNQLVELVAILLCLANLYGKELKCKVHVVSYIFFNLSIFFGINNQIIPSYFSLLVYLSLFLYGLLYYGESVKVTLLNCFLTVIIVSLFQLIVYLPVYYFWIVPYGINKHHDLVINFGCVFLIFLIGKKVNMKSFSDFILRKKILIISILLFVMVCLGNDFYKSKVNKYLTGEDYIQILLFVFLFLFSIIEWQKAQVKVERKKLQLEKNRLYYAAYDELVTLVRERQHDMKNHISAIYSMIYTIDNYEDLVRKQEEYCQYVLDRNAETKILLSTENPLLAGFIYKKVQDAEKENITVEYRVSTENMTHNIPEYELVEIVGILFDNAMEAVNIVQHYMKKIRIEISYQKESLSVIVANTCEILSDSKIEEFFQPNFSSKGKGRGIGLSKLKKIVQEMNGDIIVSNEEYDNINFLQFMVRL